MPESYVATHRLPVEQIIVNARVFVPEWASGTIIGWAHGTVIDVRESRPTPGVARNEFGTSYLVRLDNGREQTYFAYSIGEQKLVPGTRVINQSEPIMLGTVALRPPTLPLSVWVQWDDGRTLQEYVSDITPTQPYLEG